MAALLLAAVLFPGQPAEPDFSGRWRLVSAQGAANAAPELVVEQTITRQTARGEPMRPYYSALRIERRVGNDVRTETHRLGLMGGSVSGVAGEPADAARTRTAFSVVWRDRSLVFERESRIERGSVTESSVSHEETWSMDAEGRLVIVSVARTSGVTTKTSKHTYARVP